MTRLVELGVMFLQGAEEEMDEEEVGEGVEGGGVELEEGVEAVDVVGEEVVAFLRRRFNVSTKAVKGSEDSKLTILSDNNSSKAFHPSPSI